MTTQRIRVGVLMGDPTGIGPEVALKALASQGVLDLCKPVLIGSSEVLTGLNLDLGLGLDLIPSSGSESALGIEIVDEHPSSSFRIGAVDPVAGERVISDTRTGFRLVKEGRIDCLAMAPINKEALTRAGQGYSSEFDLFAALAGVEKVTPVVKWKNIFRTTVVGHVPFRDIASQIDEAKIVRTAVTLEETIRLFGVLKPRIGVAALNPHGGEGGLCGDEEITVIGPAVQRLREMSICADGPIPADTVFVRAMKGEFDGVVFLYHDQGTIAMKAVAFGNAVVIYAGLPFLIVTPSHGSAHDIAGKGIACPDNMIETLKTAAMIVGIRHE
jgi:4-hydroxy-L-threonine phosphate dehydrogenase PdxA